MPSFAPSASFIIFGCSSAAPFADRFVRWRRYGTVDRSRLCPYTFRTPAAVARLFDAAVWPYGFRGFFGGSSPPGEPCVYKLALLNKRSCTPVGNLSSGGPGWRSRRPLTSSRGAVTLDTDDVRFSWAHRHLAEKCVKLSSLGEIGKVGGGGRVIYEFLVFLREPFWGKNLP